MYYRFETILLLFIIMIRCMNWCVCVYWSPVVVVVVDVFVVVDVRIGRSYVHFIIIAYYVYSWLCALCIHHNTIIIIHYYSYHYYYYYDSLYISQAKWSSQWLDRKKRAQIIISIIARWPVNLSECAVDFIDEIENVGKMANEMNSSSSSGSIYYEIMATQRQWFPNACAIFFCFISVFYV